MNGPPIPEVTIDGKNQTVWSSNNYLGLANHNRLISAAQEALQQFGAGSTGSRLTTGNSIWHEKLEKRLPALNGQKRLYCFQAAI